MIRPWVAALLAIPALVGCDEAPPASESSPTPLLYEIASADGEIEGWMFGTIHALPDGTSWRNGTIESVISEADYLIVEIADLGDSAAIGRVFADLSITPELPLLTARIGSEHRSDLDSLIAHSDFAPDDFAVIETWAAALMLAQVDATGDTENGVDRAVIRAFGGREVREFEGALAQLRIFDSLPEADQRDLLEGVVQESEELRANPSRLRDAWLAGDEAALEEATRTGIMADPELREALLLQRNRKWAETLSAVLPAAERPLIAVGAGHLVGQEGLPTMLEAHGYSVRRLSP